MQSIARKPCGASRLLSRNTKMNLRGDNLKMRQKEIASRILRIIAMLIVIVSELGKVSHVTWILNSFKF